MDQSWEIIFRIQCVKEAKNGVNFLEPRYFIGVKVIYKKERREVCISNQGIEIAIA